jgi:MFS superfamily sulfate permease-like transporter
MNESMIYWWTRLDSISETFTVLAFLFGVASIALFITWAISKDLGNGYGEDDIDNRRAKLAMSFIPRALVATVIFWVISILTPTSKDYAMILVVPKIADSEISQQIQKDMPEIYKVAKDTLKEMLTPKKST